LNRFSPEFAAKLRHRAQQVGRSADQFARKRRAFGAWVAEYQNMMVINPFGAHYNDHMRPHYAVSSQDNTTESYHAPESPQDFMRGVFAVPGPSLLMEAARLPPRRHIVPILFRRERQPAPTVEEQAVERVLMVRRLINEGNVAIPVVPAGLDRV